MRESSSDELPVDPGQPGAVHPSTVPLKSCILTYYGLWMTPVQLSEQKWMVEVRDLTKFYIGFPALSRVSFNVRRGEFLAVTGHNGAGKTTLLRILSTLSRPSSGTVRVNGLSTMEHPESIRKTLAFLTHGFALYQDLTAAENLRFFASLYGKSEPDTRLKSTLESCGLSSSADLRVRHFSHGMKKRLGLARLMLISPELLLLDEPQEALDEQGTVILKDFLESFKKKGGTTIVATHNLPLVLFLSDRVLTFHKGKLISVAG